MLRNGHEVRVQPLLRGLVVVWRNHQLGCAAQITETALVVNDGLGAVGARAADHRHAAIDGLHRFPDHLLPFFHCEGGGLAGGAAADQRGSAVFQLKIHQPPQGFHIHLALPEGRDQRGGSAAEQRLSHDGSPPVRL